MNVPCTTPGCAGMISIDEVGNGSCAVCGTKIHAPKPVNKSAEGTKGPVPVQSVGSKRFPQGTKFGKYSLDRYIGGGAMGDVYLVYDQALSRRAALKVPKFTVEDNSELLKRFEREARNAAKVRHKNICAVFDFGREGDYPFLVTEFIDGDPLSSVIKKNGPMVTEQGVSLIVKIAEAMGEAHHQGVIHRDLKTANVLVNRSGEPIITDFGLARADSDEGLTASGTTMGTTHYMSPEQLLADSTSMGPRADVYSLGVVLYEVITGRRPYEGSPFVVTKEVLAKDVEPPVPSQFRDGIPPALDAICKKAIAKNLLNRYASMKEFSADLEKFLRGESTSVETVKPVVSGSSQTMNRLVPDGGTGPQPPWGTRILIGALVLTVIGLIAYIVMNKK